MVRGTKGQSSTQLVRINDGHDSVRSWPPNQPQSRLARLIKIHVPNIETDMKLLLNPCFSISKIFLMNLFLNTDFWEENHWFLSDFWDNLFMCRPGRDYQKMTVSLSCLVWMSGCSQALYMIWYWSIVLHLSKSCQLASTLFLCLCYTDQLMFLQYLYVKQHRCSVDSAETSHIQSCWFYFTPFYSFDFLVWGWTVATPFDTWIIDLIYFPVQSTFHKCKRQFIHSCLFFLVITEHDIFVPGQWTSPVHWESPEKDLWRHNEVPHFLKYIINFSNVQPISTKPLE